MTADEPDIYDDRVLDHYQDPYHRGGLAEATHRDYGNNPLCGDMIILNLRIDRDERIAEAFFEGDGCVISQASASMLVEQIEGKTLDQLNEFSADSMLQLFGPPLTPNRQKCCLLSWRVLQTAVQSPIDDDDDAGEPNFGGPTLGDET